MTVRFDSSPDDIAEHAVRHFVRGKTYATNRWRGAILCGLVFAVFGFLGFHSKETVNLAVVCGAAAAWGGGVFLLAYKGVVRGRIRTFVTKELAGKPQRSSSLEIGNGRLSSAGPCMAGAFLLNQLVSVADDGKWIELFFGGQHVCLIPSRSFESTSEKEAFISALRP